MHSLAKSAVVALLGLFIAGTAYGAPKPNIIFIFVDDLGWGDLGVNFQNEKSGKKHATPELDRMADEGVKMLRHYCPAPVCAPSRSSLLSGLHQGHANVRDNQFDKALADNHTLGTLLNGAGYKSVLVGKYGLQGKPTAKPPQPSYWPAYPTKRGFDQFFGYVRHADGHQHYPGNRWPIGNSRGHKSTKELWDGDKEISGDLDKCFTVDLFTAYAKKWITDHRKASPDQPFFMYLAHDTPHGALQVATGPYPDGRGAKGGVQWLGNPGKMINTAEGKIDSFIHPDYRKDEWSEVEQRFASLVRRIDTSVGDLLQLLRDLKIDDNTLVVFTSDNGPHSESYIAEKNYKPTSFRSYGPLDGMKRDVWEGGIRVPTLAWWPKTIPAGRDDRRPSQFHDWLATFANIAGVPTPALSDGVSLIPNLTGKGTPKDSTVYIEYSVGGATPKYPDFADYRQGRKRGQAQVLFLDGYKGVRTNIKKPDQDFEIYDVEADPSERKNLLGTSGEFETLNKKLKETVLQLRRPNESAKRPYDGLPVPAADTSKLKLTKGIRWNVHEGKTPWVPRPSGKPSSQTSTTSLKTKLPANGTAVFNGYLEVATAGDYTFHFESTGKAVVRLHEAILIDADYGYKGESRSTSINLAKGVHPISVFSTSGDSHEINLSWENDGNRAPLSESNLSYLAE